MVEVEPIDPTRQLDVAAAEQVEIMFTDGRLLVRHPKLRSAFTKRYGSVKVLVRLPTGSDVRGDTAQGECVVQGVVGSCRLTTAIGDLRVGQAANVRLRTSGGKVIVDHVTGRPTSTPTATSGCAGSTAARRSGASAATSASASSAARPTCTPPSARWWSAARDGHAASVASASSRQSPCRPSRSASANTLSPRR